QVILVGDDQIREAPRLDRAEVVLPEEQVRVTARVRDERGFAADGVSVDDRATDHLSGNREIECLEGTELVDLERVRTESPHDAAVLDLTHWRHGEPLVALH